MKNVSIPITNLERQNRGMITQAELMAMATEEKGSPLTKVEQWFVWTHPEMTFDEIKEMLKSEKK